VNQSIGVTDATRAGDFLVGALLYASTLYFSSNAVLLGVLGVLALRVRLSRRDADLALVWLFSLLALANVMAHFAQFDIGRHASSFAVALVALSATLAPHIAPRSWRVFVVLTCVEVLVGAFEYFTGTVALTAGQAMRAGQEFSMESELLYDLRVFGLSANSSLLAEKVFMSIVLVATVPTLFRHRWIPLALLASGLFFSFNRTAILCTILFVLLHALSDRLRLRHALLLMLLFGAAALAVTQFWDQIVLQATRGSVGELSYSELSRLYYWEQSLATVQADPLLGNGSLTFRIEDLVTGHMQHAHNSFAMLFATHGLVIPLALWAFIALRIDRYNWRAIAVFMAFSMTQYFVFWNLSVPDLLMFWLLGRLTIDARRPSWPAPAPSPAPAPATMPAT
jgi:hypothetical protein